MAGSIADKGGRRRFHERGARGRGAREGGWGVHWGEINPYTRGRVNIYHGRLLFSSSGGIKECGGPG